MFGLAVELLICASLWNACKGLTFCKDETARVFHHVSVHTASYPVEKARTSSACPCRFDVSEMETVLEAVVVCPNSNVVFHTFTEINHSKALLHTQRCDNVNPPHLLELLPTSSKYTVLTISVDADESDLYNSYSVTVLAKNAKSSAFERHKAINVTCQVSEYLVLNSQERVILACTLGLGLPAILALVIACCCFRRKMLKLMRLTIKPKQNKEQQRQGDFVDRNKKSEQQCQDEFKHENGNREQQFQDEFSYEFSISEQQFQDEFSYEYSTPEQQCQDEFTHDNGNREQQFQDEFTHENGIPAQQFQDEFTHENRIPEQKFQDEFVHENRIPEQQCQDEFENKYEHPEPTEKPLSEEAKYIPRQQKSKLVHVTNQIQSKPKNKDLVEFAKFLHERRKLERGDSLRLPSSAA